MPTTPSPASEAKPLYQSKTAVVNAIIAIVPLYPPAAAWVSANPGTTLVIIGLVNVVLRIITKGRIALFGQG